ncbi:hypothetical protein [Falsirhodobacter deserti]|uniref:hypothetical protein n=1 Tax=Falsirhodobacter deserti TaxID=1365611 RepID=UPI000FE42FEC|nr:hypothetical protein [Falsirhodobacter deserti]
MQAQDMPATDLDDELQRLAADLVGALAREPVPPAILDLAERLQAALDARKARTGDHESD